MVDQEKARKRKPLAAILIMLAVMSIVASLTRLHGRPALLSGAAGGVLLVVGILQLVKKN
jgi:hypothetical protein